MAGTATVLKWHGGKSDLAAKLWNVAMKDDCRSMPIHVVEPFCGGAAFTIEGLARGYECSFVINDISRELTNFWRLLQDEERFNEFARKMEATPFSEVEFNVARLAPCNCNMVTGPCVQCACEFFVINRMSLAGRMKGFTGVTKTRLRRGMNNEVSAWLSVVDGLPYFHSLLRKALILDARDALEVIQKHDGHDTLFYVDPPYVHDTRATTGEYAHEMTDEQHRELWRILARSKARWMLSGYPSPLYEQMASAYNGVHFQDFAINNHASGAKTKEVKTERLWLNF